MRIEDYHWYRDIQISNSVWIGNDFILSRKYDIFFLTKENSTRLFDLFLSFPLRIQNYTGATTLGKESSENMGDLHWPRLIRTFPPEVLDDKLFPGKNRVPFEIQREILLRYVSAVHARVRHIACEDRGSGDRCIYNRVYTTGWMKNESFNDDAETS